MLRSARLARWAAAAQERAHGEHEIMIDRRPHTHWILTTGLLTLLACGADSSGVASAKDPSGNGAPEDLPVATPQRRQRLYFICSNRACQPLAAS